MDDFLPESLPPVQYFLEQMNSPGLFWFLRILLIVGLAVSMFLYHRYRRNLPAEDEKPNKKKGS